MVSRLQAIAALQRMMAGHLQMMIQMQWNKMMVNFLLSAILIVLFCLQDNAYIYILLFK
jgi:hypothetical protein